MLEFVRADRQADDAGGAGAFAEKSERAAPAAADVEDAAAGPESGQIGEAAQLRLLRLLQGPGRFPVAGSFRQIFAVQKEMEKLQAGSVLRRRLLRQRPGAVVRFAVRLRRGRGQGCHWGRVRRAAVAVTAVGGLVAVGLARGARLDLFVPGAPARYHPAQGVLQELRCGRRRAGSCRSWFAGCGRSGPGPRRRPATRALRPRPGARRPAPRRPRPAGGRPPPEPPRAAPRRRPRPRRRRPRPAAAPGDIRRPSFPCPGVVRWRRG